MGSGTARVHAGIHARISAYVLWSWRCVIMGDCTYLWNAGLWLEITRCWSFIDTDMCCVTFWNSFSSGLYTLSFGCWREIQTFATINTMCFSKYWCHIFQIDYELDVTSFISKYWCHIFQINYELDVIGFAVRDFCGIFNEIGHNVIIWTGWIVPLKSCTLLVWSPLFPMGNWPSLHH